MITFVGQILINVKSRKRYRVHILRLKDCESVVVLKNIDGENNFTTCVRDNLEQDFFYTPSKYSSDPLPPLEHNFEAARIKRYHDAADW